jgi:prepilin-type N-terminal cleavage/methylation domain-containing protein
MKVCTAKGVPQSKKRTGFTLVELLVVLAILGIMSVVVIPSLNRWMDNYRVRTATRQLATDMQFARMNAVSQNRTYMVTVNPTTNQYVISTGGVQVGPTRDLGSPASPYYVKGASLQIVTGANPLVVTFSSLGTASPTGVARITVNGFVRNVTVDPSGRIRIG